MPNSTINLQSCCKRAFPAQADCMWVLCANQGQMLRSCKSVTCLRTRSGAQGRISDTENAAFASVRVRLAA